MFVTSTRPTLQVYILCDVLRSEQHFSFITLIYTPLNNFRQPHTIMVPFQKLPCLSTRINMNWTSKYLDTQYRTFNIVDRFNFCNNFVLFGLRLLKDSWEAVGHQHWLDYKTWSAKRVHPFIFGSLIRNILFKSAIPK